VLELVLELILELVLGVTELGLRLVLEWSGVEVGGEVRALLDSEAEDGVDLGRCYHGSIGWNRCRCWSKGGS
jgi:hypothetical protein